MLAVVGLDRCRFKTDQYSTQQPRKSERLSQCNSKGEGCSFDAMYRAFEDSFSGLTHIFRPLGTIHL